MVPTKFKYYIMLDTADEMWTPKEPVKTRFDVIRTVSSVITAVSLLVMVISMFVAGAYTVTTVSKLQSTYHPERLANIIGDASETMHTIHQTTTMLKSGRHGETMLDDVHRLIHAVESLSTALQHLQVQQLLTESSSWRTMTSEFVGKLKHGLADTP